MLYRVCVRHSTSPPQSIARVERVQMLEASLYITDHLPEGAKGIWALVHCAAWMALGELEWVPFQVLRKSVDINLLG